MVAPRVTDEFQPAYATPVPGSVVAARLAPPAQQARILPRPRVDRLLAGAADFPLTLVLAHAGAGKTTALAALAARGGWPAAWLRMTPDDTPALLLAHLAACFAPCAALDQEPIAAALAQVGADPQRRWTPAAQTALELIANQLAAALGDDTLLVLDDYHLADERPELRAAVEQLLANLPPRLHLLVASRAVPSLAALPTAQARGEALRVGANELAFTPEEARALFALYDRPARQDLSDLTAACRGWPLALQQMAAEAPPEKGDPLAAIAPRLDAYLEREVLAPQPAPVRDLLLRTALLRWLDQDACAAAPALAELLGSCPELDRRALFIETDNGRRAYQPLFHAFLQRAAARAADAPDLHAQFAQHYLARGDLAGALHHLLAAGAWEHAADTLELSLAQPIDADHAAEAIAWIQALPEEQRRRPGLLEARAAAERSVGHFELALRLYRQAEESYDRRGDIGGRVRALRGRAEVYLDTVQPAPAVALLKQALKLMPRDGHAERAEILRLQAENWANSGRADVAMILEAAAAREQRARIAGESVRQDHALPTPSSPADLPPRLLLRAGRLHEARRQLETALGLEQEHEPHQALLLHREPILLLSLIYAFLGSGARAVAMARRGLLEAQRSESPLTEAVALMRLGHATQLVAPLDEAAAEHYRQALDLIHAVGVARTRAEAYLGLTLLHGHAGSLGAAEAEAREGLLVAEAAGDEWTAALLWLALGGAAVAAGDTRAPEWLEHARQRFCRGGDHYGEAAVALWAARWHLLAGSAEADRHIQLLLTLCERHGYDGLLTSPTLFGPRDRAALLPILLRARALPGRHAAYAQALLRQAFPSIADDDAIESYHPGYTLRVQMLGSFRVWRGPREIHARDWQREKARQLLQLLLTFRGTWLQREQICAWLWPESDLAAAERQFKVTLNALNTALEPQRPPRTAPFFIRRQGLAYSFAPSYGCWIDVDEFELRTATQPPADEDVALRSARAAVQLYQGDFLAEVLYDPWTTEERERLLARYLAAATILAARLSDAGRHHEAAELCEQVIRRDHGYEEAYQALMRAHALAGSRSQAMRAYARCVQALADDLGIEPLPETTDLFERIKRNEPV
ncbi:MAG: hypothetical protein RLZZ387_284 [Chloroflexota bacterium]|jgi:DNA-binding SARP family transcriptional activator